MQAILPRTPHSHWYFCAACDKFTGHYFIKLLKNKSDAYPWIEQLTKYVFNASSWHIEYIHFDDEFFKPTLIQNILSRHGIQARWAVACHDKLIDYYSKTNVMSITAITLTCISGWTILSLMSSLRRRLPNLKDFCERNIGASLQGAWSYWCIDSKPKKHVIHWEDSTCKFHMFIVLYLL